MSDPSASKLPVLCPKCQAANEPGRGKCAKCGAPLRSGPSRGFLVTLCAIAGALVLLFLVAMVYPVFTRCSHPGPSVCQSNIKQLALALLIYAGDNDDTLFASDTTCVANLWNTPGTAWWDALEPYVKNYSMTTCPKDDITDHLGRCAEPGKRDGEGFDAYQPFYPDKGEQKWPLEKAFVQSHPLPYPRSYAIKHSYRLALPALSRSKSEMNQLLSHRRDLRHLSICGVGRGSRVPGRYRMTKTTFSSVTYPAQKVMLYEVAPFHIGKRLRSTSRGKDPSSLDGAARNFAFADGHVKYYRADTNNLDVFGAGKSGNGYSRDPSWTVNGPAGKDLPDGH